MTELLDTLALRAAWHSRRWTQTALTELEVGFDDERFTLPIRHADGELAHLERYAPPGMRNGSERKMLAPSGARRDLFPEPERYPRDTPIMLTEGAPAAITVYSGNVAACGVPSATSWQSEWAQRFAERDVIVLPDAESKARARFEQIALELVPFARAVRLFDVYPERTDGADVGDYLLDVVPSSAGADELTAVVLDLLALALERPALGAGHGVYEVTFTDTKPPKLLLPTTPPEDDTPALAAWLSGVMRCRRAHPIIAGRHFGSGGRGRVELLRAGAEPMKFEPASVLNTAKGLIGALIWQADQTPWGFKDEHAREIAFIARLLCGPHRELSDADETLEIVAAYMDAAVEVDGYTLHGTTQQRYEAATAMRRSLDGVSGRPVGPPRYLVDVNTDEIAMRVSELQSVARTCIGASLPYGWLDTRMEHIGWSRVTLEGFAIPGREGRRGPRARMDVYRGALPESDVD